MKKASTGEGSADLAGSLIHFAQDCRSLERFAWQKTGNLKYVDPEARIHLLSGKEGLLICFHGRMVSITDMIDVGT